MKKLSNNNKKSIELSRDFTRGSIPKHLIKFTIPLFLGNLLQTLYNTVDTIWVGKFLGSNALAAVSVSFPIIFILVSLVMGITMATTVLVAQYKGAGDNDMVKKTINNSMFLLTIASITISIIGIIFHKVILVLMNTPQELINPASSYLNIIFAGLIFMFGYNVISAVLRGLGDSRTPLRFLFYTTMINIVLDPVFIFGFGPIPKMGINGAALATIISQGISFYLAVRYLDGVGHFLTVKLSNFKYDRELTKKIVKIGLPAGIQQTVVALGSTVIMSVVNSFGPTIVAAWGAASKIDSFSFMPSMSIGLATSSLTGQNLGAGKYDRVHEVMKWSSLISVIISGIITLMVVFIPRKLLMIFTNDINLLREGSTILRILGISYIPFGLMWVSNGIIRGAGDTIITMIISMFSLWVVRVPLAFYLSKYTSMGSDGIWVAMTTSSVLSTALSLGYYFTGRWKKSIVAGKKLHGEEGNDLGDLEKNLPEIEMLGEK
ncbi:MATE family efflux transporter [Biomaibacter acetigenes]|uniref:Probable multidrug resistance protein NorM n=1 Tax=Biomaibacter acetigenes TaxID=2316383 RepID=A0A3G2R203_9FIRM|nr:MATE family efflux transporter [Biomaibacter acetigenes]RKL61261.1 MATE family efflux transporter [Thermoanaerobacteraceae bacterium SP2]